MSISVVYCIITKRQACARHIIGWTDHLTKGKTPSKGMSVWLTGGGAARPPQVWLPTSLSRVGVGTTYLRKYFGSSLRVPEAVPWCGGAAAVSPLPHAQRLLPFLQSLLE